MPRYGMVIDLERCIGCQACTVACKMENGIEPGSWIKVKMLDGQPLDTAHGQFPNLTMPYLPVTCMHCQNPPCVDACPTDAIYKRVDGVVILESSLCNGCENCLAACPYDAILWNDNAGTASKCHLCAHRIGQGEEPFCVLCCEGQAMHFGDFANSLSEVSQLVASRSGFTLKPEEETGATVYYLPPLEKRPL